MRCAAPYGVLATPTRKVMTSRIGSDRSPLQCNTGTSTISGARTASQRRIVRCGAERSSSVPLGIPNNA